MLQTDYAIEWTGLNEAILSWDGGVTDVFWTIFINGTVSTTFEDSGTIERTVTLNQENNHSIAIVRHTAGTDVLDFPEASVLLRPTVRWLSVDSASDYLIYQVDTDDEEFLIHTEWVTDDPPAIYEWQFPVELPIAGESLARVKLVVEGSFGVASTPYVISGFVGGHPSMVRSITPQEDSSGAVLVLDKER